MARVKRGVTANAKHKKVLKAAKGYYGRRKNTIRIAKQAVEKANQYAFRDRKRRKRTFRALWIQRLNAAVRPFGLTYSRFIDGLSRAGILVDRQVLSDLAIREPVAFEAIVWKAKAALACILECSHCLRRTGIHFAGKCSRAALRRCRRIDAALAGGAEHAGSQSRTSARPLVRGAWRRRAVARPHGGEDLARPAGAVRPHG